MLPSAGFVRITCFYAGVPVPTGAANTWCVADVDADTALGDIADTFQNAFDTVVAQMVTGLQLATLLLKRGPDETGESATFTAGQIGASGGEAVAPNTSVLITKNTTAGGRAGRGRSYMPGFRDDAVSSAGAITGSYVTAIQAAVDSFFSDMATANLPLMLEHGSVTPYPTPTTIASLVVNSTVATQRRRLRR